MLNAHNGGVSAAVASILKITSRLHVIQATSYISAGYALMDLALVLIFALMTASNWPVGTAGGYGIAITVVITYLYTYLRLIISDLENPFSYPENYCLACYASGKVLPLGFWEEIVKGGSISSISILTVTFGNQLKELMLRETTQQDECGEPSGERTSPPERWWDEEQYHRPPSQQVSGDEYAKIDLNWLPESDDKQKLARKLQTLKKIAPTVQPEKRKPNRVKESLGKWRLALRCIPIVLVLVGLRFAVWYGIGTGGWMAQTIYNRYESS